MRHRNHSTTAWRLRTEQEAHPVYGPFFRAIHLFTERTIAHFFEDTPNLPYPILQMEKDRYNRTGYYVALNGQLLKDVINLNPFALRNGLEAAETIAHELVHLWENHTGAPTTNNNHTEAFHQTMMSLYGIRTSGPAGVHGGHDERWDEWLNENADLNLDAFSLPGAKAVKPRRMVKHICPECEASFHARTAMNVRCGECGRRFIVKIPGA